MAQPFEKVLIQAINLLDIAKFPHTVHDNFVWLEATAVQQINQAALTGIAKQRLDALPDTLAI